jgi:hypothetical protein
MSPAVIGKPAPAFSANSVQPDGSFKTVSLSDFKGTALMTGRQARRGTRADAPRAQASTRCCSSTRWTSRSCARCAREQRQRHLAL